jgi:DNA primase
MRKDYTGRLADWTNTDPNVVFLEVGRALGDRTARSAPQVRRTSAQVRLERDLLKVALQYPEAIGEHAAGIDPELISVPVHRAIWREVLAGGDAQAITGRLTEEGTRETVRALAMEPIEVDLEPDGLPPRAYVAEIVNRMKDFALRRLIDEKKKYLQRLNPVENEQEYKERYADLIALEGERHRLNGPPDEAQAG